MGGGASNSNRSSQKRRSTKSSPPSLPSHVLDKLRVCLTSLPYPQGVVDKQAVSRAAEKAERVDVSEPQVILTKGENAKGIYIIIAGEAQVVSASGTVIAELSSGDLFGELSTLFHIPCTATVKTPTKVLLLLLKPEVLTAALNGQSVTSNLLDYFVKKRYLDTSGAVNQSELMYRITKTVLKEVPLFSQWGNAAIESLVKAVQSEGPAVTLAPAKSLIAMEGDPADEIVIIVRGRVEVLKEKEVLSTLDSARWPVWHGEEGLFAGSRSLVSVRTVSTCQMIIIKNAMVHEVVKKHQLEAAGDFNKRQDKWRLRTTAANTATTEDACYRLEVLIHRLSETNVLSKAPLNALYKIALNSKTLAHKTGDCIIGESSTADQKQSKMIKSAGGTDASKPETPTKIDATLPPGTEIKAEASSQVFWGVPKAAHPRSRLEAKTDSVILHFTSSALDEACSNHPDVVLTVPSTVR
ncbi:uncharacterized protein LOC119730280 isoform X2 [Patiria miniata]|uniref:Cyclic nucleotide-binding domain-containing protein n=1 Tax=Patiria miniata TaxID=46514 RepID=A0A914A5L2_PATMI|nr:uncharacterized protein LOC119730280 isoform X2 [Patiria miniata]